MNINVIDQRNTEATRAWRVELRDDHNLVVASGYGQTVEEAYYNARQVFIGQRESETRTMLKDADAQFVGYTRKAAQL